MSTPEGVTVNSQYDTILSGMEPSGKPENFFVGVQRIISVVANHAMPKLDLILDPNNEV